MFNISDLLRRLSMLRVSALKSIKIFGLWDQPRKIVAWDDVKQYSWHELRTNLKFSAQDLKTLQPSKHEWLKRGNLKLFDLPEMSILPVPINPFEDLGADLAEVWSMQWNVDMWKKMGITYHQMKKSGLTPQLMECMQLEFSDWVKLDMKESDITDEIAKVFQMSKEECCQIIKDYT